MNLSITFGKAMNKTLAVGLLVMALASTMLTIPVVSPRLQRLKALIG